MAAIELDGMTMEFRFLAVLRSVNLTVEVGEIFGFLGPNGVGSRQQHPR